ncbi:MAG: hypothetical protein QE278_12560 [Limnobacter sp.]|nr:hypothetical protein [Limnobacter sp.]
MEKATKDLNEHGSHSLDNIVSDGKSLLNSTIGHAESGLEKVKQSTSTTLDELNQKMKGLESSFLSRSKIITEASTAYINKNPIKTVAAASVTGLLIGFLLSSCRN